MSSKPVTINEARESLRKTDKALGDLSSQLIEKDTVIMNLKREIKGMAIQIAIYKKKLKEC